MRWRSALAMSTRPAWRTTCCASPYRQLFGPPSGGGVVLDDLLDVAIGKDTVLTWSR